MEEQLKDEKNRLRIEMKERRKQLSKEQRRLQDADIAQKILNSKEFKEAQIILGYYAINSEVDLLTVLKASYAAGKQVFLPKVLQDRQMEFYRVEQLDQLITGPFQLKEPTGEEESFHEALQKNGENPFKVLCLVPGLAFDENGGRLGYGKGYYDTFFDELQKVKPAVNIKRFGVAYACQMVEKVPCQTLDVILDGMFVGNKHTELEDIIKQIEEYLPFNEQEERDRELILRCLKEEKDVFCRSNALAHMTASAWVVNKDRTKVLMAYHNIYQSYSWLGGHADGEMDLAKVALKEVEEESGLDRIKLVTNQIFSLESLTVDGHKKKGNYVSSHIHLNVTFLIEADETQPLRIKKDENSALSWFGLEEAIKSSNEVWFQKNVYTKLNEKMLKENW